jgi:uncharacterized protein YndB with AHSA1/START domain
MPTARHGTHAIEIAASPEHVYGLVSDVPRIGEWSPECYRAEWLDGACSARVGARFRGYNRRGPIRWHTTAVVTAAEPATEFAFTVIHDRTGREQTHWRYELNPTSVGTMLTESFQFLWCPIGNRISELFIPRGSQVNRGIEQTLRAVKSAAESSRS